MNEAPDAEREPDGYIRLPWQIVGGALFLFLAALFAFGLFANRNLRPQLTVAPTAVSVGEAQTPGLAEAATPTALVGAPPKPVGTATPQPAAAATATVAVTATSMRATANGATAAAATSEPAATPAPVLTAGTATIAVTPTREAAATPRPTVSPELAAEVGDAYKQYWQVRAEALFDLDTSRLSEVMSGEHLAAIEKLIEELRSEGHAIQTDVNHKYAVVEASSNDAEIEDTYTDSSVYVDAQSHAVLSEPANDVLQEQYQMSRINGGWRVVGLVRAS